MAIFFYKLRVNALINLLSPYICGEGGGGFRMIPIKKYNCTVAFEAINGMFIRRVS